MNDNSPLVVIDGITAPNGVSDLNMLNPADIESMTVLKDAGVSAIYGSRSANGVLLVTTKKGKKNQAPTVSYNGMWGEQYPRVLFSPLPAWQNAIYKNESLTNVGQAPIYTPQDIQALQQGGDHEWFLKQILHPAPQQSHNLTLSGGGEHTTFLLSAGYVDQSSNFVGPNYGFTRDNFRVSASSDYGILKASGSISYTHSELKNNSYDNGFLMADAERTPTNYSMVDSLGRYLTNAVLTQFNPLGILQQGGYTLTDNDEVMGNLNVDVRLPKGFGVRGTFGGDMTYNHGFTRQLQVDFYPEGVYGNTRTTGDSYSQTLFTNLNLMGTYDRHFGDHAVSALIGASNESTTGNSSNIYYNYTDSALGIPTTGSVVSPGSATSNSNPYITALNSLFGRANYQYLNRYMLEVDFRYDGSSKFAQGLRWGLFPSVSGAWRATDEPFLDGVRRNFGNIKLRASYGILGNQAVNNYQYLTTYAFFNGAYGFNNSAVSGTAFSFANEQLQWEKAGTFNGGADVETMKGKLNFSLDYFNKLTRDILVPPAVPGTFGGSLPDYNKGKMRDLGWEFSVKYTLRTGDFVHSFMANLADNRNEVISFPGNQELNGDAELQTVIRPGVPFQSYVGYKRNGYFQNENDVQNYPKLTGVTPIPGNIKYKDKNGDGIIDNNDWYVLGNPFPRYTYGFTYNVSWKGIDASIFIQGVGRRDMFVRGELVDPYQGNYSYNIFKHQLNFWSPTNSNAQYPILSANGSPSQTNDYTQPSNLYLFNGAYMRVKNIQVGYTIPASAIHKLGVKKLRIYFTGQNLWTIAGVKFLDPESTEFNQNLSNTNGNNQSGRVYPTPVFYGGGLDLTF
jgi:TonB-linked SusC/RagA family outer membrane protein